MRKHKVLLVALVAGLLSVPTLSRADSLLERIAMAVLADKFGINTQEVIGLREQTQLPVYELAPIYEGSHYFKQKPSTVWQLRNQGLGWGQIAQRVGMHPGTFNKLRKQGAFDRDRFWETSYQERFNVPTQRVEVIRKAGGTLEDVLGAIIIGKLTRQDPSTVYNQYQTQRSWTTITSASNVRFEDWRRVSVPLPTRYILSRPPVVRTHPVATRVRVESSSKSKSKGKSDQLHGSKGKHGSDDKAKKNDKSKGKGHSNKGNSKGKGGKGKGG